MEITKFIKTSVFIVLLSFSLSGCLVAAVGAGVAAVKYGNAKKGEAQAKKQQSYNEYVLGMQKINMEREQKGLKPQPIMSSLEYYKVEK